MRFSAICIITILFASACGGDGADISDLDISGKANVEVTCEEAINQFNACGFANNLSDAKPEEMGECYFKFLISKPEGCYLDGIDCGTCTSLHEYCMETCADDSDCDPLDCTVFDGCRGAANLPATCQPDSETDCETCMNRYEICIYNPKFYDKERWDFCESNFQICTNEMEGCQLETSKCRVCQEHQVICEEGCGTDDACIEDCVSTGFNKCVQDLEIPAESCPS